MQTFVENYFAATSELVAAIPADGVDRIGQRLFETARSGSQVLLAGNGGSASTASHLACDFAKTVLGSRPELRRTRFRAVSLADNVALLTAWANDVSYDSVFAEQVKMLARSGDVLMVISASGSSPNAVTAVETAKAMGVHTIGLLGCEGGRLRDLVDDMVIVPSHDFGHIESVHLVIGHLLTQWLSEELEAHDAAETAAAG